MKNRRLAGLISITLSIAVLLSCILVPGLFALADNSSATIWDGTVATTISQGKGTEAEPYIITNGAELAFAVKTMDRKYFKLANDIYLNNVSNNEWYEEDNLNQWFGGELLGHLNGDGHIIYGVYINTTTSLGSSSGYGLISKLSLESTVKNLGLEKSYINAVGYVGGIVGNRSWISNGKEGYISNCYVGEDVILKGTAVGGILGVNTNKNLTINNCYSLAQITATEYQSERAYQGGIIADNYGRAVTISNCYTNMVLAGKAGNTISNSYQISDTFTKESMQGKDVFTNSSKMVQLNSTKAFVATEGYPVLKVFEDVNKTTYKISELDGKYKTQGRTAMLGDALMLDYSASGIELNVECLGDIDVTLVADVKNTAQNGGLYFTVIVDDKEMYDNLRIAGDNNAANWKSNTTGYPFHITQSGEIIVTIAEDLSYGEHNIKIYNQTEAQEGTLGIKDIRLDGIVLDNAPDNNELYIEIVGDSIAAGLGNISVGGDGAPLYQDALRGWPYLTAKELEADWSIVAQSGITATNGIGWKGENSISMQTVYPLQRYYSDKNTVYGFERKPNVILVSLGTNDIWTYNKNGSTKTLEDVKTGIKEMLDIFRDKNPNAKVVWLYGMMTSGANEVILSAIAENGGAEKGFYALELPKNVAGGQGHPDLSAQKVYADTIADYVKDILGLKGDSSIWDGKKTMPTQGSGIAGDPYIITNGSELAYAVSNNQNKYFKLANDIYLNDVSAENWYNGKRLNVWDSGEFRGCLDGDGHVVYGIYVNTQTTGNYGLVSKLALDSTVKNIGVENAYIDAVGHVGGIVALRDWKINDNDATISNCYVGENVILKGTVVGGIIAVNTVSELTISHCYSLANITATSFAGGITGDQYGKQITVLNCYTNTVLAGKDANRQTRTYCYEVTDIFTKEKMQGKDVFANFDKMPYLNIYGQYCSTEKYPILAIFSKDPNINVDDPIIATGYETGFGTKDDPYIIKNEAQLRYLMTDGNTKGKYYQLANDIYINNVNNPDWMSESPKPWYTFTNGATIFSGIFDGRGHYIHGIFVNSSNANKDTLSSDGTGLFPFIDSCAIIKNVHVRNSYISGFSYAGAIAGYIYGNNNKSEYASIIGCSADNSVTVKGYAAGGLLGGGTRGIEIYYSYFTGNVSAVGELRGNALVGDIWSKDQRAAQCYTIKYINYRDTFIPKQYSEIYSNIEQPNALKEDIEHMIGNAAKTYMPKLNWDYWDVIEDNTPHPKVIEEDKISYFYDEGVKGRVWSGKNATKYAGGTGTEDDPYLIETPEQLAMLVDSCYDYNVNIAGCYYKLTADIKLNDTSNKNWEENANNWFAGDYCFDGHLDGNGHIISGLYYKGTAKMAALFPYINISAVIENLGITESTIITHNGEEATYAASIAAGVVKHWKFKGESESLPIIRQCFADTTVHLEAYYVGGLTGFGPKPVRLENCFFTGKLNYVGHGGGLIGDSWVEGNEVVNCYTATVDRDTALANNAGKLSMVENLYVDGPLNGSLYAETLNLKAMFGDTAIKWMKGFDFENIWKTVDEGTPVLRIFKSDKYTCKREPQKVSIEFLSLGGSQCETIYGYPRFTEITELPTPTRYGYKFDGWYFYEEYDIPFNLEVFPDYNIWLYPKWVELGFTKDFEKNTINTKYDINGSVRHFRPGVMGYNMDYIHGGMKSLHCLGDTKYNPAFLLSYENKLTVGNVYEIVFWMTTDTENTSGEITLVHTLYPDVHDEIYAYETGLKFNSLKVGEWKQYSIKFTAGTPYLIIQTPSNASIYFDDIQVIETGLKGKFNAQLVTGKLDNGNENVSEVVKPNTSNPVKGDTVKGDTVKGNTVKPGKNEENYTNVIIIAVLIGVIILLVSITTMAIVIKKRRKKA